MRMQLGMAVFLLVLLVVGVASAVADWAAIKAEWTAPISSMTKGDVIMLALFIVAFLRNKS